MRGSLLALVWILMLTLVPESESWGARSVQSVHAKPVPSSLFGLHILGLDYGIPFPALKVPSWRSFRSYWVFVQPSSRDVWDFELLDKEVGLAEQYGIEMVLVLGSSPTWASSRPDEQGCCGATAVTGNRAPPKNIEDWQNYVKGVAKRYKGRVTRYEMWNEANVDRFYSGSIDELVELQNVAFKELKRVDPQNVLVSVAASPCCRSLKFLSGYLSAGGGDTSDVIGYHFYVAPMQPESMIFRMQAVKRVLRQHGLESKPLWNTETGWKVLNSDRNVEGEEWGGAAQSPRLVGAYLVRSYILSWMMGVERMFWYAWGHRIMGLTNYAGDQPNEVAFAFERAQEWLVGKSLRNCTVKGNLWACQMCSPEGASTVYWTEDDGTRIRFVDEGQVVEGLFSEAYTASKARFVRVNSIPISVSAPGDSCSS